MSESSTRSSLYNGQSSFDVALRVKLSSKFRSFCKVVPLKCHCWINSVAITCGYAPIQLHDGDMGLRMRIAGLAISSGLSLPLFDCELGTNLSIIDGKKGEVLCSLVLSNPPKHSKLSPLIIIGTQNGRIIIRDLQTCDTLYENISKFRHPGPIHIGIHYLLLSYLL